MTVNHGNVAYQFVEITNEDFAQNYYVEVGNQLNGYVRQIRIHQHWDLDMSIMPNNVLDGAMCNTYGYDAIGVPHDCDQCSTKAIDSHDENTCYFKGEFDSYGADES